MSWMSQMSQSAHARRKRSVAEPEPSLAPLTLEPAVTDPSPTPALSAFSTGHMFGAFAIQRCGPTPCDCSEEERAAYEEDHESDDEYGHGHGQASGHSAQTIQRAPDDGPTSNPGDTTLGGNLSGDATQMKAGASGSTTIHRPTLSYDEYSAATLADVASLFPPEVGSVTFDFTVNTSGDPVTSARLDVTQAMRMPRWLEYSRQCRPVKQAWDSFYAALRNHEDGHVTRDNQQFSGQHTRFIGQAQSDTQTVSDQLRADVQAAQDAYDSATDHGRTQTPPTVLDTSVTCSPSGTASGATSELGAGDLGNYGDTSGDTSGSTGETQTMQAARADGGDGRLPADDVGASVRAVIGAGGGQPLDETTRAFMEPRFGHNFSQVRVHTDAEAARSAEAARARAYTIGSVIVFAADRYAPQTSEGRHLLAHELTHVTQQAAGSVAGAPVGNGLTISDPGDSYEQAAEATALRVIAHGAADNAIASALDSDSTLSPSSAAIQRWTNPIYTLKSNAELIEDGVNGDIRAIKEISDFSGVTDDQKLSMIRTLLDQFWVGPRDESALERIWNSFGDRVLNIAAAHMDLWKQSEDRGAELMDEVFLAKVKAIEFPDDVKVVVSAYLSNNFALVQNEMQRIFSPTELVNLRIAEMGFISRDTVAMQDPSAQQANYMRDLQTAAVSVAKLQRAQEDARKIDVGYDMETTAACGGYDCVVDYTWLPTKFDPYKPPQSETEPELSGFAKTFGNTTVVGGATTPYATVKEKYDKATEAIAAWQTKYPELYAISRERKSEVTAAFAGANPQQARKQLGIALLSLTRDIIKTQQMLDDGDLDPLDMTPIHDQLFHNQLIGDVTPSSGTNWADPLPNWIAKELVSDHNFWKVLKRLALDTIAQAGYLLAPFTGGASLLVSLAVTGYEAVQSEMNYEAMNTASRTAVAPGTDIYTEGQVDAAKMQADSDEIAFALAALAVGMEGAGRAFSAIRGPAGEPPGALRPGEVPPGEAPPGSVPPLAPGAEAQAAAQGKPIVVFRGTTYQFLQGRSANIHDLGQGVYMTTDVDLGLMYAQERRAASQALNPGAQGVVLRMEVQPSQMGRVLDISQGSLRQNWEAFLRQQPTGEWVLRGGPAEMYNGYFESWLQTQGLDLNTFDVIIGPEYIRGGTQVCVRNEAIANQLLSDAEVWAWAHDPVTPAYPAAPTPSSPQGPGKAPGRGR